MKKIALVILAVLSALATFSCGPQSAPDTRAADERAIRETDSAWSAAAGAKDLERTVAYYAPDAVSLPANAPIATDMGAIRKFWEQDFAMPGYALSWKTAKVEVSRGGDMGYAYGTYEFTFNDAKGKPMTDRGKYLTVWKKQADGKWKAVADMFNSDLLPMGGSSQ
jgi:ketosteroid isomerase-like protein